MPKKSGGGGGKSAADTVSDIAKDTLDKVPEPFVMWKLQEKYPTDYNNSMNTVLVQECIRFNGLINAIRSTLASVIKGIKGEVVMSAALEQVFNSVFDNMIPSSWLKVSYPSLKKLGGYVQNLLERLEFLQDWVVNGPPATYWVSGLFFPQAFLTGSKQSYARKYVIPIDTVAFDFEFFDVKKKFPEGEKAAPPADGAYLYGMFLDGARWDWDIWGLADSKPKELLTDVPHMALVPGLIKDINASQAKKELYRTPFYKTSERKGVLSTTGHSTNFVMAVQTPRGKHTVDYWVKRGTAFLSQTDD